MESEELKNLQKNQVNKNLFKGLVFFLSREINKELFEFVIKSFGGEVYYHSDNFNSDLFRETSFTHVVLDRVVKDIPK